MRSASTPPAAGNGLEPGFRGVICVSFGSTGDTAVPDTDGQPRYDLHFEAATADTLLELSCYAEDPFSLDTTRSRYAARLVLVDNLQSEWQCAKYEGNGHLLIAADPRMADFNTLQQLLWRLLLTASLNQVAA